MSASTETAAPSATGFFRGRHLMERNLRVYRMIWPAVLSGGVEPAFYLFAVGIGVGALVGDVTGPNGQPVSYALFVTPGLLAASAMNGAVFESTYNLFFKFKFAKTYEAVLATPMEPIDVATGEISFSQLRGALYGVGFLAIAFVADLVPSVAGALLAVPFAILIGFAFAAVGMASVTFARSWQDLDLVQVITLPLFLFSATFFPLEVFPEPLQWIALLSPLYHGVELVRSAWFWAFDWSLLGHAAVLVTLAVGGMVIASRRLGRLLLP